MWRYASLSILAVVLLGLLAGFLGLLVAAPLALVAMLLVKMLYLPDHSPVVHRFGVAPGLVPQVDVIP